MQTVRSRFWRLAHAGSLIVFFRDSEAETMYHNTVEFGEEILGSW